MQMSVILCSHGLLDWFNKTILFYIDYRTENMMPNQIAQKKKFKRKKKGSSKYAANLGRRLMIFDNGTYITVSELYNLPAKFIVWNMKTLYP